MRVGLVSSPATPPKNGRGESRGALAKFLGCADVAFSIPELPIRSTRRAFTWQIPGATMVTDYARSYRKF